MRTSQQARHASRKLLIIDAVLATILTVGAASLFANEGSNATMSKLTSVGAVDLNANQLINHMRGDTTDGHIFWLGPKDGFNYSMNNAEWGRNRIVYHQSHLTNSNLEYVGARVETFANADFLAAHLHPLEASLLASSTTPKARHAAYDLTKMDEVVVHIPGEIAVVEIYFASKQTLQTLLSAADSLVYFS